MICKNCHWFKSENPYVVESNGKFYPCTNIGIDGWKYWVDNQNAPKECEAFCTDQDYIPSEHWQSMAKVIKELSKRNE